MIQKLIKKLQEDREHYESWQANIAMAYLDCESNYRRNTKKKYLNRIDKHTVANNAAKAFLSLLIDDQDCHYNNRL